MLASMGAMHASVSSCLWSGFCLYQRLGFYMTSLLCKLSFDPKEKNLWAGKDEF